jgi:hypothetical protein
VSIFGGEVRARMGQMSIATPSTNAREQLQSSFTEGNAKSAPERISCEGEIYSFGVPLI